MINDDSILTEAETMQEQKNQLFLEAERVFFEEQDAEREYINEHGEAYYRHILTPAEFEANKDRLPTPRVEDIAAYLDEVAAEAEATRIKERHASQLASAEARSRVVLDQISTRPDQYDKLLSTNRQDFLRDNPGITNRCIPVPVSAAINIQPPDWLVSHILPSHAIVFLYGPEGIGKSFLALDLAFSIALGVPFAGHPTKRGPVLYVNAEGIYGLGTRILGYLQAHSLQIDPLLPLFFVPRPLELNSKSGRTALFLYLHDLLTGDPAYTPSLIILDTFGACTAGADESSSKDMGEFLGPIGEIRRVSGCTFLCIHHARKDRSTDTTYRGHSSLAGSADAMILVKQTNKAAKLLEVSCTKQKDDEQFPPFPAQLTTITLPDGRSTCYVTYTPRDKQLQQQKGVKAVTASDLYREEICKTLQEHPGGLTYTDLSVAHDRVGSRLSGLLKSLEKSGRVVHDKKTKLYSMAVITPEKAEMTKGDL